MIMKIPLFKPYLNNNEKNIISRTLDIGFLGMGKNTLVFENLIKKELKLKNHFVLCCNTGFSALHLALISLNLKKNDEVIIPSFSNVANIQTILNLDLKPVFCDIDDETFCIDTDDIQKKITKQTKVVMFIDYGCSLANYNLIKKIANKNKLKIIHDAAHSFGSKHNGKFIESIFDITMFSFDPIKTITSIDGGALILRNKSKYNTLKRGRNMGISEDNSYSKNKRSKKRDVTEIGLRYHLSNINSSVGISQIKKFKDIAKRRIEACNFYIKNLSNFSFVKFPKLKRDVVPFIFVIRVEKNIGQI